MNMKKITLQILVALLFTAGLVQAQEVLRSEVGTPLRAAQDLMKAGKNKEALAKVRDAEAVGNRSVYESFIIDRMRGSAAAAAGDEATAIRSFEAALASGQLQGSEQMPLVESLSSLAFRAKDYTKAIEFSERYFKLGGTSESMRSLQVNAYYLKGDFAGVARDLQAKVEAAEQATPVIDEQTLLLLASSYQKLGNTAGYAATLERLLVHHPKKSYWMDLITSAQNKPNFADRLELDVYRLLLATDNLSESTLYVEMAQLAMEAGLPAEAKKIVNAGYAAGKLGAGTDAERHKRLRDSANKQTAEDEKNVKVDVIGRNADALVNTGQWLVSVGQLDKGIVLMEQGIAKGGLKHLEDAKLHVAQAYLANGDRVKASAIFKSIKGVNGTADLARLWFMLAKPK
jgi:tetratricopeptide (TPR) repeat protein